MGKYSVLDAAAAPMMTPIVNNFMKNPRMKFRWHRRMEAWKFGSGADYKFQEEDQDEKKE
jgi:hypothetical protein